MTWAWGMHESAYVYAIHIYLRSYGIHKCHALHKQACAAEMLHHMHSTNATEHSLACDAWIGISLCHLYIWDREAFRNAEWGMSKLMLLRSRADDTCSHHVHSMNATEHSSASACWCRTMIFCIGRVHMMRACVFGTACEIAHAGANSSILHFDASYVYMLCLETLTCGSRHNDLWDGCEWSLKNVA